jgi:predicted nuclease of predicted toxin-antitoxin system
VTKDKDFANLRLVWGAPPKVIFLQLGNCSVRQERRGLARALSKRNGDRREGTGCVVESAPTARIGRPSMSA